MLELNGPGGPGPGRQKPKKKKVTGHFVSTFCPFCFKSIYCPPKFAIMGVNSSALMSPIDSDVPKATYMMRRN